MPPSNLLLTNKDRTLILKVSSLLEETIDVLEDKETMKSIKQAEQDIKAGRVRSYKDRRAPENSHTLQCETQKNSI